MRTRYDFVAQEGTHFGIIRSIDEIVAEIANPVDIWNADASAMTIVDGKVSAWLGRSGRQLAQANAALRPTYTGNGLRFMDQNTMSPNAYLALAGTQIAAQNTMTVASRVRLVPESLPVDLHYLWGWHQPFNRLQYRYVSGNNFMRLQVGNVNVEVDLPANHGGDIGAVAVYNFNPATGGGTTALHIAGVGSAVANINAAPEFQGFTLGGAGGGVVQDMPGWASKLGIWTGAASGADLAALLAWVG
ncbi:hypothetical protein [Paracoccus laeviglucosivorans]|uniref:Uncharacterized protein n=1 Tax=Paracoccus laeviglucosivorans TaxID=1197861 RepID=A0A521CXE7_9RHOB|nr:hypothetical protein [Paracoccus laeviglucosivorans]SMO64125.1 hypothetical protein SAMN06265221_105254 [Paracoccus laeviglucosivorans]